MAEERAVDERVRRAARPQGAPASWWKKRLSDWNEGDASSSWPALVPALVGGDEMGAMPEAVVRLPAGVVVEVMSTAAVVPQWLSALTVELARAK